jgi:hypothetical protein
MPSVSARQLKLPFLTMGEGLGQPSPLLPRKMLLHHPPEVRRRSWKPFPKGRIHIEGRKLPSLLGEDRNARRPYLPRLPQNLGLLLVIVESSNISQKDEVEVVLREGAGFPVEEAVSQR